MLRLICELKKNCCGRVDGTGKSKVLQEVLADLKITLSTNLDMHNRFQGSFCCDLPLQDPNLVSASGEMVTG